MNRIFIFYKKYISPLNPPCCRFYPTCSEYSMLCFKFQNPFFAIIKTILRLLKCNQIFSGGLDYPIIKLKNIKNTNKINLNIQQCAKINKNIDFWLIPIKNNKFYIIRNLRGSK